jgi:Integrase core domain
MFLVRDIIEFKDAKALANFEPMANEAVTKTLRTKQKGTARFGHCGNQARVIDVADGWLYLFNILADTSEIWKCHRETLRKLHLAGHIELLEKEDRSWIEKAVALSSQAQIKRRDDRFEDIAPLLEQRPNIFDKAFRSHAVTERAREQKNSARTIHTALYRYWRFGLITNALLPRYDRVGVPLEADGKTLRKRTFKVGHLGALPKVRTTRAPIVTDEIRELFAKMTTGHYRKKKNSSLRSAYKQIVGHLQSHVCIDQSSGRVVANKERAKLSKDGIPTLRQYYYWYKTSSRKVEDDIARVGETRFMKDRRATIGSAISNLYGIGSRFEIDATLLDVGCVADSDRRRYVGRPTLYVVIDVYSKMIVGIYLGYQSASWQTARLAIRNIVEDKVKYCSRFGLSIAPDEWPVKGILPTRILADRGEFEGYKATDFVARTGVTIENTAPYRGDLKGTVEKRFDLLNRLLRQLVPGTVTKDHAERGDNDYRTEAKLNLRELTRVVLMIILYMNNDHALEGAHQPADMFNDNVLPIPRDMWRWAEQRGRTEYRRMDISELEYAMLDSARARTSPEGLRFKGFFYHNISLQAEGAFIQGQQRDVTISWDPQCVDTIWLHTPCGGFEECNLTDKSGEYAGLSFVDAKSLRLLRKEEINDAQRRSAKRFSDLREQIDAEIKKVTAESSTKLSNESLSGASGQKAVEQLLERAREAATSKIEAIKYMQNKGRKADIPADDVFYSPD